MENGDGQKPSTTKVEGHIDTSSSTTSLKNPTVPILMFLGVIAATLSVIVAGYFHGHMSIAKVYHSLTAFV